MNTEEKPIHLPLTTLFEILEENGFRVGIDLRVKLQVILNCFHEEIFAGDLDNLKYYIRPLIVKSQSQQIQFDYSFQKYTHYIRSKIATANGELDQLGKELALDEKVGLKVEKFKAPILLFLAAIAFILFSLIVNIYRDPPSIHSLAIDKKWISVNDSLSIKGRFSGMFMKATLLVADTSTTCRKYSANKDIITLKKKFEKPGNYEVELVVANRFTSSDSSTKLDFTVCEYRPRIDFKAEVDSLDPLRVIFYPEVDAVLPYSILSKLDGIQVTESRTNKNSDGTFSLKFENPGDHKVELTVLYDNYSLQDTCAFSTITKNISLESAVIHSTRDDQIEQQTGEDEELDPGSFFADFFDIMEPDFWRIRDTKDQLEILLSIIVFGILPLVIIEIFIFRRIKIVPSPELADSLKFDGINPPFDFEIPDQSEVIQPEKELFELSRTLKQRIEAGILKFDLVRSIQGTSQNSGFIQLLFTEITKVPEYLVIVDQSNAEEFHVKLFKYLSDFLHKDDTLLDVFYFGNSPRYLNNAQYSEGISLDELYEKFPDHTLLFFSDGDKLINKKLDRLFQWASIGIPKWRNRFLLTTNNPTEWGRVEELIDLCIPIMPATLKGMLYMSECLTTKHLPDFKKRIKEFRQTSDILLGDVNSLNGIREFLKDEVPFQWFCCIAIYPRLHWQFIIAIGKALCERYGQTDSDFKINYQSLYKISEVSDFLSDKMDDEMRMELMKQMDPKAELIARQAILDLLNELKIPIDSYAYKEAMVQAKINHALLNKDNKQARRDLTYLWKNNYIEDRVIKAYLSGENDRLFDKKEAKYFRAIKNPDRTNFVWRVLGYATSLVFIIGILNVTLFQKILPNDPIANMNLLQESIRNAERNGTTDASLLSMYNTLLDNFKVFLSEDSIQSYRSKINVLKSYDEIVDQEADTLIPIGQKFKNWFDFVDYIRNTERYSIAKEIYRNYEVYSRNNAMILDRESFVVTSSQPTAAGMPKDTSSVFKPGRIFMWTRINAPKQELLEISWYFDEERLSQQRISINANTASQGYRIWDYQTFDSFRVGNNCEVRLYNGNNDLIGRKVFRVIEEEDDLICKKYSNYSANEWRRNFLMETQPGTWHVFVGSLSTTASESDAKREAELFRARFKNLDVNVMPTLSQSGQGNYRYALVVAEGLEGEAQAREIAQFARDCGIAKDAIAKQQIFENSREELIPQESSIPNQSYESAPPYVNVNGIKGVKIGDQLWMAENLDVSTYRNGDTIPEVKDPEAWANLKSGAWCNYNNDPAKGKVYGKFYNWYAVNDPRGLAPEGWHVPTDEEWTTLTDYLGGVELAGGKLKEADTIHWELPNQGATNETSFTALPGGARGSDGTFYNIGSNGYWWSASEATTQAAWIRETRSRFSNVAMYNSKKKVGFSVRCVRD